MTKYYRETKYNKINGLDTKVRGGIVTLLNNYHIPKFARLTTEKGHYFVESFVDTRNIDKIIYHNKKEICLVYKLIDRETDDVLFYGSDYRGKKFCKIPNKKFYDIFRKNI